MNSSFSAVLAAILLASSFALHSQDATPTPTPAPAPLPAAASQPAQLPETVVTARSPEDYAVPNASVATKTDTPVMDTPLSIQTVPRQVLQDQQVTRVQEALSNVSGVYNSSIFQGLSSDTFIIRGFRNAEAVYLDGFRYNTGIFGQRDLANIEQIEVLKGPASILYGRIEPGGLVNLTSKPTLKTFMVEAEQQVGSFDFCRTTLDAGGPLTRDGSVSFRLNAAYENAGSFREFVHGERWFVAPKVQWDICESTRLTLEFSYLNIQTTPDNIGIVAIGNRPAPIPLDRNLGEPTWYQNSATILAGCTLDHKFNESWKVRARMLYTHSTEQDNGIFGDNGLDVDGRTLLRDQGGAETVAEDTLSAAVDLVGNFHTGPVEHTLLIGGDYYYLNSDSFVSTFTGSEAIDIFNPQHTHSVFPFDPATTDQYHTKTDWFGFYLQEQMTLPYGVHLLAGFRYDHVSDESQSPYGGGNGVDEAVTPRFGLLWRPAKWISLYGSYVENFGSANGDVDRNGNPLPPESAWQ